MQLICHFSYRWKPPSNSFFSLWFFIYFLHPVLHIFILIGAGKHIGGNLQINDWNWICNWFSPRYYLSYQLHFNIPIVLTNLKILTLNSMRFFVLLLNWSITPPPPQKTPFEGRGFSVYFFLFIFQWQSYVQYLSKLLNYKKLQIWNLTSAVRATIFFIIHFNMLHSKMLFLLYTLWCI